MAHFHVTSADLHWMKITQQRNERIDTDYRIGLYREDKRSEEIYFYIHDGPIIRQVITAPNEISRAGWRLNDAATCLSRASSVKSDLGQVLNERCLLEIARDEYLWQRTGKRSPSSPKPPPAQRKARWKTEPHGNGEKLAILFRVKAKPGKRQKLLRFLKRDCEVCMREPARSASMSFKTRRPSRRFTYMRSIKTLLPSKSTRIILHTSDGGLFDFSPR